MSKTITFAALKGGVGKTTISYQFSYYLAKQHPDKKVLVIDLDHQERSNISALMRPLLNDEQIKNGNIGDVFESEIKNNRVNDTGVEPQKLATPDDIQLYGLLADSRLAKMEYSLTAKGKGNGSSLLGYLFTQGYNKEFDYIVIDTHPNLEEVYVTGAMICSDDVFTPIVPSKLGMGSIVDMSQRFQDLKAENTTALERKPLINAKLHWLGNMINFTNSDHLDFLKAIRNSDNFSAYFRERTALNKVTYSSEYVINYLDNKKNITISDKRARKEILTALHNMEDTIDDEASVRSEKANGNE